MDSFHLEMLCVHILVQSPHLPWRLGKRLRHSTQGLLDCTFSNCFLDFSSHEFLTSFLVASGTALGVAPIPKVLCTPEFHPRPTGPWLPISAFPCNKEVSLLVELSALQEILQVGLYSHSAGSSLFLMGICNSALNVVKLTLLDICIYTSPEYLTLL